MVKGNIEAKRKLLHLILGVLIVILLSLKIINKIHIFSLIIIAIIISFLSKKYKIPVIYWFLHNFEREKDLKKFPGKGLIFYLIGVFLVLFFPLDTAKAAILVLAFAEPASYLFGMKFGKIKHPLANKRFLEGFVAGIIAGFIGALIFVPWQQALAASFFAMTAEGLEIKIGVEEVDDNIIIPVVAAVSIWAVRVLF